MPVVVFFFFNVFKIGSYSINFIFFKESLPETSDLLRSGFIIHRLLHRYHVGLSLHLHPKDSLHFSSMLDFMLSGPNSFLHCYFVEFINYTVILWKHIFLGAS